MRKQENPLKRKASVKMASGLAAGLKGLLKKQTMVQAGDQRSAGLGKVGGGIAAGPLSLGGALGNLFAIGKAEDKEETASPPAEKKAPRKLSSQKTRKEGTKKSKERKLKGENEDLIDPQGVMSRKLPFYQPVQLADREEMVELYDEDISLEGTGTLSGHRQRSPSPEALQR